MDRRALWAIVLMMIVAIAPVFLLKRPAPPPASADSAATQTAARGAHDTAASPPAPAAPVGPTQAAANPDSARADSIATLPQDTVLVSSDLYQFGVSTRGARLVVARLANYKSMAPETADSVAQLLRPGSELLGLTLVTGRDTLPVRNWNFTPSDSALTVNGATPLTLTAAQGNIHVRVTYTFNPDNYQIGVSGQVTGLGPNGGLLLVGMGPGLANTEGDSTMNQRAMALVTKSGGTDRHDFGKLDAGVPDTLSGPFEWVAVKSKYFVTAVLAPDSSGPGRISGVTATAPANAGKRPSTADVELSLPISASGQFSYTAYAGPMEYHQLRDLGHGFDDVNPYGWPGVRTLIHFFVGPVRMILVWMHTHLNLAYGWVLIFFGLAVRLILWPLNQKAMRSSMAMQAIQPQLKAMQEKYKDNPQKQQQEMVKLYREHGVNPLGGCWPMLLPMPVLFALFFVFENSIELRGQPFLWLPDLSQADPLYIIPIVMGLSMFVLSKVGQMGMEKNSQANTIAYVMPLVMTFFFYRLAAGLNLYYAVSNLASIPQQWLLAKERQRRGARQIMEVSTKMPAAEVAATERKARKR
ncbi:MAG TPA: membrane protein insertase YidC [Gemmatimonadales bacterium]|nr:membrane protein insertase YidC [Gemmatimonadales bacterium]